MRPAAQPRPWKRPRWARTDAQLLSCAALLVVLGTAAYWAPDAVAWWGSLGPPDKPRPPVPPMMLVFPSVACEKLGYLTGFAGAEEVDTEDGDFVYLRVREVIMMQEESGPCVMPAGADGPA